MSWRTEIDSRLADLSEKVEAHIANEVGDQIKRMIDEIEIYPESNGGNAMWIHLFNEEVLKRFSFESILLDWFDVAASEQTAKRAEMEAWAESLEQVAKRIRTVIAEGRYAEEE